MPKIIVFRQKGNFRNSKTFLRKASRLNINQILERYAKEGVEALREATPKNTGTTANSWYYKIERSNDRIAIVWSNSNIVNGVPIAVILQYGHGTRNGGYVEGIDYINPAMKPIFDRIAERAWGEVMHK